LTWERAFLSNIAGGIMVYEGLHLPHETRGWALKPGLQAQRSEQDGPQGGRRITYSTNSRGFRSLHEFENDPERYQVIVVGDSFTFGDDIDDRETWPYQLAELDPRLNVLNMAQTGYGIDQMYLTLKENIERQQPRLVIAAFISDNLYRSLLKFRDYKKPRFLLQDGQLKLTNTPIGSIDQVVAEARRSERYSHSRILSLNVLYPFFGNPNIIRQGPEADQLEECFALNDALVEAMAELAESQDAAFQLVYLPFGSELVNANARSYGEDYFAQYQKRHPGSGYNARPALLAATFEKSPGHYKLPENRLLGELLYQEIQKSESWQEFASEHPLE
jgi:hypothetical protein